MGSPLLSSQNRHRGFGARGRLRDHGFTLVELLVVIAIIAILAALIFPAIGNSMRSGRQASSVNNLRQWGVGFAGAVAENDGYMPADGGGEFSGSAADAWYNRMPPPIKVKSLKESANDPPKFGSKSIWINPGAPVQPVTGIPFCYGFNDYLSTKDEPTMKQTRVTYPLKTVLMAEKDPDSSPVLTPSNIRGFYGTKDYNDQDAICDVLFIDGHVESVKKKVYSGVSAASATTEEELRQLVFAWQPYEGAQP